MFVLVSVRHVGTYLDGHQHGVSIQISINFVKTFLRISRIRNIPLTWILARVFVYVPPFISHGFWTLSIERFWFLFWSTLNGVTLKTSNLSEDESLRGLHLFLKEDILLLLDATSFSISWSSLRFVYKPVVQGYNYLTYMCKYIVWR